MFTNIVLKKKISFFTYEYILWPIQYLGTFTPISSKISTHPSRIAALVITRFDKIWFSTSPQLTEPLLKIALLATLGKDIHCPAPINFWLLTTVFAMNGSAMLELPGLGFSWSRTQAELSSAEKHGADNKGTRQIGSLGLHVYGI